MATMLRKPLTRRTILAWADAHRRRTGSWPNTGSGNVHDVPGERWINIDSALRVGTRGLRAGGSLSRLLGAKPIVKHRTRLTIKQVLAWADAHHARTGQWPGMNSGRIIDTGGNETWRGIDNNLSGGQRGLPRGRTLAELLADERGRRHRHQLPRFSEKLILQWADGFHARGGTWPGENSGTIPESPGDTRRDVVRSMQRGLRGLSGRRTLAQLLTQRRGARRIRHLPRLSVDEILRWMRAYHRRSGTWPTAKAGVIPESERETWHSVNHALRNGSRGVPPGLSLAKLLVGHLGVRRQAFAPRLTIGQIVTWARSHLRQTGRWPVGKKYCGPVLDAPGETWTAIDAALKRGSRGLRGNSSLARVLIQYFGVDNKAYRPPLSVSQIIRWAEAHVRRTGWLPDSRSGRIPEAEHETWRRVHAALLNGGRGLHGSTTLGILLRRHFGLRGTMRRPKLRLQAILRWAKNHHRRTGKWPESTSGPVHGAKNETWEGISSALRHGSRGWPGGTTLARLLIRHFGIQSKGYRPNLSIPRILRWAREYRHRTGKWPTSTSGKIRGSAGDTWLAVDYALRGGGRGLPGKSSLTRLLIERCGARSKAYQPKLKISQILRWAQKHREYTGQWPTYQSGPVRGQPDETWPRINSALSNGHRGLRPGSSLARLLRDHFPSDDDGRRPELWVPQILSWARAHYRRTGNWPDPYSGRVIDAPKETWWKIDQALQQGTRGLPSGSSIARILTGRPTPEELRW